MKQFFILLTLLFISCSTQPEDCAGTAGGNATIDYCGICDADSTNNNTPLTGICDCLGLPNGDALVDECGRCNVFSANNCTEDCNGVLGGRDTLDCAGTCGGSAKLDCTGTCGGSAQIDCAGTCGGSAQIDCAGTCGGSAQIDDGWCNDGDPWPDCSNDPIDADPYDECGNCHGDGFAADCVGNDDCEDMACDGGCDQVAYIDNCGECDDSANTDCIDFELPLDDTANLISFYALPIDGDWTIEAIFDGTGCDVTHIIGQGEGAAMTPNGWIGSLNDISQDNGYWVMVSEDCTLTLVDADPVNYDADGEVIYSINYGNTLVSYPFQTAQSLGDALGEDAAYVYALASEGVAALNTGNGWVGSLTAFEGGNGYYLVVTSDFEFSFNGKSDGIVRHPLQIRATPQEYSFTQSNEQAFYFVKSATISGESLDEDDIIIAYNNDVIIGSRYWNGEFTDVPAMGANGVLDEYTAGYCESGDSITFKVLDASTGNLVSMNAYGNILWSYMKISIIVLEESTQ